MTNEAKGDHPEGARESARVDEDATGAPASQAAASQAGTPQAGTSPAGSAAAETAAAAQASAATRVAPGPVRPAPAPAPRKGSGFGTVLWTLIVVGVLAAAAWATQPHWRPLVAQYIPALAPADGGAAGAAGQLDALVADQQLLRDQIQRLEGELNSLKGQATDAQARLAAVTARLDAAPTAQSPTPAGTVAAAGASTPQPLLERADAMEQRVESVARRIDALEQRTGGIDRRVQGAEQRGDTLAQRLETQDQEVSRVLTALGSAETVAPRVEALEKDSLQAKRLADSLRELRETAVASRDEAASIHLAVLAANQLATAVSRSGPFAAELKAAQVVVPEAARPALDALAPYAATGVMSAEMLRARFPAAARAIAATKATIGGDSWTERTLNRLTQLVSVRRTGPEAIAQGGNDGVLAEAERALANGDLAAAVAALEQLDGPAAIAAAAAWLEAAKARLAVDKALVTLQAHILPQPTASGS